VRCRRDGSGGKAGTAIARPREGTPVPSQETQLAARM
jgi:hypothetical protein